MKERINLYSGREDVPSETKINMNEERVSSMEMNIIWYNAFNELYKHRLERIQFETVGYLAKASRY